MDNRPFSLLIKPASADCNFSCQYCFYLKKSAIYPDTKIHRMPPKVLETIIRSYMATSQNVYRFVWQGGEPTLMGLDFFMEVVRLQRAYGRPGTRVSNGLQTNGSLVSPELAAYLKEYNFLTGISIDGPEDLHDAYRKTKGGTGTYNDVIRGLRNLRSAGAETNALILVNSLNAEQPSRVFNHLVRDLSFDYIQFIPCLEFDDSGGIQPLSVCPEAWGAFLCEVFDLWQAGFKRRVSVRNFDALLHLLIDGEVVSCDHGTHCDGYFLVEHNGDVYPCDFFVEPTLLLGNVRRDSWEELQNSKLYTSFGKHKLANSKECSACPYVTFCHGGCVKNRGPGIGHSGKKSLLCEGLKTFYHHAMPALLAIARGYKKQSGR